MDQYFKCKGQGEPKNKSIQKVYIVRNENKQISVVNMDAFKLKAAGQSGTAKLVPSSPSRPQVAIEI
jgi:hypothetical protein